MLNSLFSCMSLLTSTLLFQTSIFSFSKIVDGLVSSKLKSTRDSSVYPCEYKCTTAILFNSLTIIRCTRSMVRANRISSAAKVALPLKVSSYPKNALGILRAAIILLRKYSISSVPVHSRPGKLLISVPLSLPRTGKKKSSAMF